MENKNESQLINEPQRIFEPEQIKKILVLRHDRIGDLVVSRSFLRILRNHLPETKIDILLSYRNSSGSFLIANYIDKYSIFQKGFFKNVVLLNKLKNEKYDLVVDMLDNKSTRSGLIIKLIKAKYSLGFKKENSSIYSHLVTLPDKSKVHIVDRISQLLIPFGINPASEDLSLSQEFDKEKEFADSSLLNSKNGFERIGIVISGSDRSKYIGTENLIKLVNLINSKHADFEIILFSTVDYKIELNEISANSSSKAAPFVSSLKEYACMLSTCDFLISTDTSAVHFASLMNIPCVALYKFASGNNDLPWTPYKTVHEILAVNGNRIDSISYVDIFSAFERLVNEVSTK